MTQAAHIYRYIRFDRRSVLCVITAVFVLSIMSGLTISARAEDIDTQKPVLSPSMTGGELRNKQHIHLAIAGDNLGVSHIRIWNKNTDPASLVNETTSIAGSVELSLDWDTKLGADGLYEIEYSTQDLNDDKTVESHPVSVNNNQPLVTMNGVKTGRDVYGTVSLPDVVFRVFVGGQEYADFAPVLAANPNDDGSYNWTMNVPQQIPDGEHAMTMYAKTIGSELESAAARMDVKLETLIVVPAPIDPSPVPVGPAYPSLELAPEIGQFIAPVIRPTSDAVQTKLYGVSVDDLTQNSLAQPVAKPSNSSEASVLGARDVRQSSRDFASVATTQSGWSVLGVAWYWWLTSIVVGAGTLYIVARNRRQKLFKALAM